MTMLSISVTPTAYISDSRLEQAIRPDEHTGLKGQYQDNVVVIVKENLSVRLLIARRTARDIEVKS